ncbi:T9SS type B sorting domain-containing protein [Flavobacterium suzhouense]|uniref:Gliding motility-associated C-terminal domain-containing protein n=1 Tax=Flavobacterium suzhouense TaxID=1529638 RepID=A0ABW5NVM0_9FLAO
MSAQIVYQHNFGTGTINTYPYTVAPNIINADLSNSAWTNEAGTWVNYNGSAGVALGLYNFTGTTSVTLSFTVAPGKQLSIDSYSFWRQRSPSGGQNWSMAINGTNVGSGTIPSSGANTGTLLPTSPVSALTGTVNIVMTLSGGSGAGTFRVDDFTLNGTVTSACASPVITSLNPVSGPVNTFVTINGSGFQNGTGTSSVKFNGSEAAFTVISDSQIMATIPAGATSGQITVTTNSCPGTGPTFTVTTSNCTVPLPPSDLYISELYDQESGSGGMIEIYNPTTSTINLSGYTLQRYGNITDTTPTAGYILNLTGTLGSEMVYLIACSAPNASICVAPSSSATLGNGFNDNDKFELLKNNVVIDRVNTPSQKGFTLIRKPNALAPVTTYNANDWNITLHPEDQPGVNLPNNYCQDLGNHIVDPIPGGTTPTITNPVSVTACENSNTSLSVALSDPTGFTYQWKVLVAGNWINVTNNTNYSGATTATLTINNIPSAFNGNQYYCEMTSGTTCTLISNAARLSLLTQPAVATVTPVQPTCTTATGSVTITAPIAADITYSINGTTYQAGTTFANLTPGTYTVTVKNAAGCTSETSAIIINPAPATPAVATVSTSQPTCTTATGSITVAAPIDTDLTYSIDGTNFQSGTTFANLTPGNYTITVKNTAGCTSQTGTITINTTPSAPAIATVTTAHPTCLLPTGSITVTAPIAAGTTYSIDGITYQSGTTFTNLTPGSYTITVKNAAGCTSVTSPININTAPGAPATATTTQTQPTCSTTTGSITIISPLATDLTYSIDGITYQTGTAFTNLIPGTYTVTVKNAAGCTSVTTPITINVAPDAPAVANTTTVQPDCITPTGSIIVNTPVAADLTYSIDGITYQTGVTFTNLAPGNYTIVVKNAAGCTSETATISINTVPNAPELPTVTTVQPSCAQPIGSIIVNTPVGADLTYSINGIDFQSSTIFNNLAAGNYTVTVKNTSGCISTTSGIIINPITDAPVVATVTTTQPTCALPTGSITITSPITGDLTYSIDDTNFQSGTTFNTLAPGTYIVTVKNTAGCTSSTPAITINAVPGLPQITIKQGCSDDKTLANNYIVEALPLDATFDINTADFEWKDNSGNTIGSNENTFNVTKYLANNSDSTQLPFEFTVTVTNAEGCENTVLIGVDSYFCNIPRGISPDNDGMNDNFNLTGMNVTKLSIFNRYGHEVYSKNNYTNEWHGQTNQDTDLPTGTYYYVIESSGNQQTGWVYLNRRD